MKKRMLIILVVTLLFSLTFVTSALAGATTDVGNVPGFPAAGTINWTAWHSGSIVGGIPQQVMTEDSTNSSLGLDQGYSTFGGKLRWVLIVSNFSSPAAVSGSSTVTVLLGGLGVESGNLWESSFVWDTSTSSTDHGAAPIFSGTAPCPTITSASASGGTQTINWSGPAGSYYVYRSQNDSGAGNGASSGTYLYQGTVSAPAGTGTFSQVTPDPSWYIVIHASSGGGIDGCHSEEDSPTAVELVNFSATPQYAVPSVTLGIDTLNEVNVSGYNIYRAANGGECSPENQFPTDPGCPSW